MWRICPMVFERINWNFCSDVGRYAAPDRERDSTKVTFALRRDGLLLTAEFPTIRENRSSPKPRLTCAPNLADRLSTTSWIQQWIKSICDNEAALVYFLFSFQDNSDASCSFVLPVVSIPSFWHATTKGSEDESCWTGAAGAGGGGGRWATGCTLVGCGEGAGVVIISLEIPLHPCSNSLLA